MKHFYLLVLCSLLLRTASASDGNLTKTALGWNGTGGDLSNIPIEVTDIWTARTSWSDLEAVGWPTSHPAYAAYLKANPNGAVDFAVGLIPHDLPSAQWNGLLDEVVSGAHDSVFVAEGQNMAKYGTKTVYCRPWWEMTINTRPLDPVKFQAAWNHAIPIIRSAFAAAAPSKTLKIAYCYLPDAAGDPKAYFPGPKNVDVIDADIYGKVWGTTTPTQAAMLASIQAELTYLAAFAAAENKPAGVSEWANEAVMPQGQLTCQGRGDDPEYIDLMLSFAAQNHFLYMVYFNLTNGTGETFANTPVSLAHFRAALTAATPTLPFTTVPPPTTTSSTTASSATTTGSATTTTGSPATTTGSATTTTGSSTTTTGSSTTTTGSAATTTGTAATTTGSSTTTTGSAATTTGSSTTTTGSSTATTGSSTTTTGSSTATTGSSTTTTGSPTATTSSTFPSATTFAAWQARYFTPAQLADPSVSGPTSDPYASGIPNLLAYALQLDPATAQPSDVPQPVASNGHLTMSYQVPSAMADVNFIPEVSSNLQTWDSSAASVQVVSNSVDANGTTTITVEDCLPSSTTKRYMRLRVTQE